MLHSIRLEVLGEEVAQQEMVSRYSDYFPGFIKRGIDAELLDKRMAQFDLPRLAKTLDASRDLKFDYLGLQTLYDRYFLHVQDQRIELPQAFFMRVAMGLALSEADREARAIEFYHTLSNFDYMTPGKSKLHPCVYRPGLLRLLCQIQLLEMAPHLAIYRWFL